GASPVLRVVHGAPAPARQQVPGELHGGEIRLPDREEGGVVPPGRVGEPLVLRQRRLPVLTPAAGRPVRGGLRADPGKCGPELPERTGGRVGMLRGAPRDGQKRTAEADRVEPREQTAFGGDGCHGVLAHGPRLSYAVHDSPPRCPAAWPIPRHTVLCPLERPGNAPATAHARGDRQRRTALAHACSPRAGGGRGWECRPGDPGPAAGPAKRRPREHAEAAERTRL